MAPTNIGNRILSVIPTYNGSELIVRALNSLLIQSLAPAEIVVIDDGSDSVPEIPSHLRGKFRVVRNSKNIGFAATLNLALSMAQDYDFMLVLQDDIELLDKDYLKKASEQFTDSSIAIVTGAAHISNKLSTTKKCFAKLCHIDFKPNTKCSIASSFLKADLMRVSAINDVKGFAYSGNRQLGSEDHILGQRLASKGYKVILDPSIAYAVDYARSDNFLGLTRKEWLYGKSVAYGLIQRSIGILPRSDWDRLKINHRRFQAAIFGIILLSLGASVALGTVLPGLASVLAVYGYYVASSPLSGFGERFIFAMAGFASAFAYGSGLVEGVFLSTGALVRLARS
ncbi:MAG TPA: glycosyltransferase [Nitrososphaerales archaeon]|nr:glycosyltransferase [Nitrososphaerales archaeon]